MQRGKVNAWFCFVASLSFCATGEGVSPSPGVIAATKAQYPTTMAREHAREIPAEAIINDLDFFLRVFGNLQDLIKTDESVHTAQRHWVAKQHLQEVISNLARSRHDGALSGASLEEQLTRALSQRLFVAARYFINEASKESPASGITEQIQTCLRVARDEVDIMKREIESFNASLASYLALSQQSKADVDKLESQAASLFGSATRREEITEQAVIELKALRTQMSLIHVDLQAARKVLIELRSRVEHDLQTRHNNLANLQEFVKQIIAEYELKFFLNQESNDGSRLPPLAQIPREHPFTATLAKWKLLDSPVQSAATTITSTAIPQPTIVVQPTARRNNLKSPSPKQAWGVAFFTGTK